MSNSIDIADLANPQLTELQQAAVDYGETLDVDFNRDPLLDEAMLATGLSDFGPNDYLQRLDLLLDEWNSDTGLTGIARLSLRNKLLSFAKSRLLIQDLLKRHPEIHEQRIERPIIVAGLPRSGTTHLLNLMAADPRLRSLPLWESYEPVPMPGEKASGDNDDPRFQRCQQQWDMMQQMTPLLAAMHPMNPEHIHEELELMGPDFASYNFEWLSHSPRWRDHYLSTDQTPRYDYLKTVLKILQWQDQQRLGDHYAVRRWVLKCPQHLEQLPVLQKTFPDATIAITHRDPVAVIQSAITMLAYGQRINRRKVLTTELIQYWSQRIRVLLEQYIVDRPRLAASQSIDVPFHTFMADDIAMIRKIYDKAQLPYSDEVHRALLNYLREHPRGKEGRIQYHLERDFSTAPDNLRKAFTFYFEKSPAKPEL
jgi:hypothetical protein